MPLSNDTLHLRTARPADRTTIADLTMRAYTEYARVMTPGAWTALEEALRRSLADDAGVTRIVAELDGRVVGAYRLAPNRSGLGDHVANGGYMVAADVRGRGIASAMCEHSMDEARRAGFTAMQYNYVVASNTTAVKLWQRHGFAIVGTVPRAFRHATLGPTDIYVMHRFL